MSPRARACHDRAENNLPKGFQLEDDGQRFVISWRWFKWPHLVGYLLLMSQIGWPITWYAEELVQEPLALLDNPTFQLAFTLGHLSLMLFLAYSLLTRLLN